MFIFLKNRFLFAHLSLLYYCYYVSKNFIVYYEKNIRNLKYFFFY